jgi:hypothetical protein
MMTELFARNQDSNNAFSVADALEIKAERDKWLSDIAFLQKKVDEANRKLAAAELLLGRSFLNDKRKDAGPADNDEASPESMAEAAYRIVKEVGGPLSNTQIRKELAKIDEFRERMDKNPNYFYTVMKRHVDRRRLRKTADGRYEFTEQI